MWKLAEFYDFGDNLKDILRDRLVCGTFDKRIQRRLLGEADLTYQKAYDLAMVMESAQKESNDLQQTTSQSAATLHAVRGSNTRSGQLKTTLCLGRIASCYHCGGQHKTSDCCFKNEKCRYCGKKGHIVQVCCRAQRRPVSGASSLDARNICTEDSPMEATANPVYEMFPLTSPKPDPLMVFV